MKRIAVNIFTVLLVLSVMLVACSKPAPTTAPAAKPSPGIAPATTAAPRPAATPTSARIPFDKQELPKYLVAGAISGGVAWVTTSGWVGLISKYTPIKASVSVVSGVKAAIEPMRAGDIDFIQGSPSQPWAAYTGAYEKGGIKKLRLRELFGQGNIFPGVWGLFTLERSGIKTVTDLKGKRIGIFAGADWASTMVTGAMRAHGWTDKDYTAVKFADNAAGFIGLKEGKIDVFIGTAGSEALATSKEVGLFFLPFTRQETDEMLKIDPTLVAGMTPGKNYQATGESKWGIVNYFAFWSRADLNEKAAHTMVKTLFDHIDEYHKVHERATDVALKTAIDNIWKAPYHPGVVRYYQETGIWKAEHTAKQKELIEAERKLFGDVPDEDVFKELGIR